MVPSGGMELILKKEAFLSVLGQGLMYLLFFPYLIPPPGDNSFVNKSHSYFYILFVDDLLSLLHFLVRTWTRCQLLDQFISGYTTNTRLPPL